MSNEVSSRVFIDISLPLKEGGPVWPNSTGVHIDWTLRTDKGDSANLTRLDMDIHAGTHVESSLHSFTEGSSVDSIPLGTFIGRVEVVYLPEVGAVSAMELDKVNLPNNTTRVLFRTRNEKLWERGEKDFQKNFAGLTPDGAEWIVNHGIALVGMDYLSIGRYGDGPQVHDILFKGGVSIIEGLYLNKAAPGSYHLICLPINLVGREGAPTRAVLQPLL